MRLTAKQLSEVSGLVTQYISAKREHYRPFAVPLSRAQRESMGGFFSPELLDDTRLLVLGEKRLENPPHVWEAP